MTRSDSQYNEKHVCCYLSYTASSSESQYPYLSLKPAQATLGGIFVWINDILIASLSHTPYYSPKKPKT